MPSKRKKSDLRISLLVYIKKEIMLLVIILLDIMGYFLVPSEGLKLFFLFSALIFGAIYTINLVLHLKRYVPTEEDKKSIVNHTS